MLLSCKWATPQNGNGPNYVLLPMGEEPPLGLSANYVMLAINTQKVHLGHLTDECIAAPPSAVRKYHGIIWFHQQFNFQSETQGIPCANKVQNRKADWVQKVPRNVQHVEINYVTGRINAESLKSSTNGEWCLDASVNKPDIGLDNGLSSVQHQAIIWVNVGSLSSWRIWWFC